MSQVVRIHTSAFEPEVRARLRTVFEEHGGRIDPPVDGWDVTRLGSRIGFRLWGLWGPGGEGRLPIVARTLVGREGGHVVLDIELTSDMGWYAFRLPIVEQAYRRVFRDILGPLESLPE
jgi:hypothetical protein